MKHLILFGVTSIVSMQMMTIFTLLKIHGIGTTDYKTTLILIASIFIVSMVTLYIEYITL